MLSVTKSMIGSVGLVFKSLFPIDLSMFQKISFAQSENLRMDSASGPVAAIDGAHVQLSLFPVEILPPLESDAPIIRPERRREDLVPLLREANQNLVRAALDAKTMQIKAEIAKRKQDEFLAMMAHELRNPLAPIAMAADLLRIIPNPSEPMVKAQQTISRQSKNLAYLLDQLLDAARLSNGNIEIRPELIDFTEIIRCTVETIHPHINQKQQHLWIDLSSESIFVHGDPIRLAQVFSNLLINASKFSNEGADIWLTVRCSACEIHVSVKDEGMGVTSEFLPHIFDLFSQAPQGLARTKGGLGIGLTLTKSILEKHGGSVSAQSAGIGFGCEFTVRLPRAS